MTQPLIPRSRWWPVLVGLTGAASACGGPPTAGPDPSAADGAHAPGSTSSPSAAARSTVATPTAVPQLGRFGFGFEIAQHPSLARFAVPSRSDLLLYDRDEPALRARLSGDGSELRAIAFAPDGKQVLAGTVSGQILAWELDRGTRHKLTDLKAPVFHIVFSPDGQRVATVSRSGVHLFPRGLDQDQERVTVDTESFGVRFAADGKLLLARHSDLVAVDSTTGTVRWRLAGRQGPGQNGFAPNPNGSQIVWSPDGQQVSIVATADGKLARQLASVEGAGAVYWSSQGSRIAVGGRDVVKLFDAATGAVIATLPNARAELLGFSPDGATLGVVRDNDLLLVDAERGSLRHRASIDPRLGTRAWCADSACVLVGMGGRGLGRVDVATGKLRTHDQPPLPIRRFGWSPDGQRFAVIDDLGEALIATALDATIRQRLTMPRSVRSLRSSALSWSPDGSLLAIGSTHELHLFDGSTGIHRQRVFAEPDYSVVRTSRFSPDGRLLAMVGARDTKLRLFSVPAGQLVATLDNPARSWSAIAWSPDGRRLATGGHQGVAVLDVPSGRIAYTAANLGHVLRVAWLGSERVVAGQDRGSVIVLRLGAVQPEATLELEGDGVFAMTVSGDGRFLAGAGRRGPVRIWSGDTLTRIADLPEDGRELGGLEWHPCLPWLSVWRGGLAFHKASSQSWIRFELFQHGEAMRELLAFDSSGSYAGSALVQRHLRVRDPGALLTARLREPRERADLFRAQIGAPLASGCDARKR